MTAAPSYTRDELRRLYGHLSRLLPPGGRPLNAEEAVDVSAILDKTRALIAVASAKVERGAKVLEWRLPNLHAPTLNQYAFMKTWQRMALRKTLDDELRTIVARTPNAKVHGDKTQRWVRVTRFTINTSQVDDLAVDALGGKMPLDSLVRLGVLVDDTPALCHREALVRPTVRGNTHVLFEVFETAAEEVPDGGPVDAPVVQVKRKKRAGRLTRAITGDG